MTVGGQGQSVMCYETPDCKMDIGKGEPTFVLAQFPKITPLKAAQVFLALLG